MLGQAKSLGMLGQDACVLHMKGHYFLGARDWSVEG